MPDHPFTVASRYIESLRSPTKKRYARDYYQWIRAGRVDADHPADPPTLSYMAAQAVRMNLDEIMPAATS